MSSVARSAFLGAACGASLGALAGIGASPCGSAILGGAGAVCGAVYGALYATTHHRAVDQIGTVAYGAVLGGMGGMVVATQTRNCTDDGLEAMAAHGAPIGPTVQGFGVCVVLHWGAGALIGGLVGAVSSVAHRVMQAR